MQYIFFFNDTATTEIYTLSLHDAIPSYMVKVGDVVAVREKSKKQARIVEALQLAGQVGFPAWVEVSADKAEGTFKKSPDRDEFGADINESLIVELYSR